MYYNYNGDVNMNNVAVRGFLKAVIIVGLIFVVFYYVSYNKWLNHDFDSVDITYRNDDLDDNSSKNDSINDKEYKELYSNINYELLQYNFGEEFYDVYYNNKPFYDEYYIYVGVINIIKNDLIINCNFERTIKVSELQNKINSLFGNIKYNNKSFTTKNNKISINYNADEDSYTVKLNGTCSGFDYSGGGIKSIYRKTEIDNNSIYIYEKSLYVLNIKDKNGNIKTNYYKDINKDSQIIANTFEKVDIGVLPTYVYKFTKENNNYTLKSINRLS